MVSRLVTKTRYLKSMIPKVIFVLGGPGVGKRTQCQNIVTEYDFVHLSVADLVRQEHWKRNFQYGKFLNNHVPEEPIVPARIICRLLERAIQDFNSSSFVINGFPRNKDDYDEWERNMSHKVDLLFILFFDCHMNIATNRSLGRPTEDSRRTGDNLERLQEQFTTYMQEAKPVIDYYYSLNWVNTIDARYTPDVVFKNIKNIFNTHDIQSR